MVTKKDIDKLPRGVVVRCCTGKLCTSTISPQPCIRMDPEGVFHVGVEYVRDSNGERFKDFTTVAEAAAWVATVVVKENT